MIDALSNFSAVASAAATGPAGGEGRVLGEETWWPPWGGGPAGVAVTESSALRLSAVLSVVNVLATDVAVLPLAVYQRRADGGRREAREHPADRLLRVTPDEVTTPVRWRAALMGHALTHGNGYAEIQRRGRGTPMALHLLDPCSTRYRRKGDRAGYDLDGRWIEAANVLHVAGLGYDGVCGYNLIRLMGEAIGLGMAGQSYAADYFTNGAEPRVVLETPHKLGAAGRENLRDGWNARHGGAGQRHGTAVLEQGTTAKVISANPEESQILETRKFQVIESTRPWRVPPHKYGDFSEAHLSNIEAANLDYLMTALMVWLTSIEQEFGLKLFTRAEQDAGYYVKHNTKALLRGDIMSRFSAYNTGVNGGWMSRNDVRSLEEMDPIPADEGGDLFTVQSQNVPLSQIGKEPAAPEPGAGSDGGADTIPMSANRIARVLAAVAANGHAEPRINKNHDAEGKFAHSPSPLSRHAPTATRSGAAMEVVEGAPKTPGDAKFADEAASKGKAAFRITDKPGYEETKTDATNEFRVGGKPYARVEKTPQADLDAAKEKFKDDRFYTPHPWRVSYLDEGGSVSDTSGFTSRGGAVSSARRHAKEDIASSTTSVRASTKDPEGFVSQGHSAYAVKHGDDAYKYKADDSGPGWTTTYYHIKPGGGERYNPNRHPDGKFAPGGKGGGGGSAPAAPATPGPARDFAGAKDKEVKAYHDGLSADAVARLSDDERKAVRTYTSAGNAGYGAINGYHRHGYESPGAPKDKLEAVTASLDSAIAKGALPEPIKVYRGIGDAKALGIEPGVTIHDKGYLSTSLTPKVAAKYGESEKGAVLEIAAPKGAKALSVAGMTSYGREREVLFPRDSRMKVTGTRVDGGRTVYTAELQ